MPFDPRKHILRPPAGGAPQPPRPYQQPKPETLITSSRRLLAVPGKIDIVPFTSFPEIARLNFSQYSPGFVQMLRKRIGASAELEEAVNTLILNLFAASAKVVQPGKMDYNRAEREYTHDQLMEYVRTIPCLEVVFGKSPSIGNFTNKEKYFVDTRLDAEHPLKGKYHLAYVDDNYRDSFARAVAKRKEHILEDLLYAHVSQMETIEREIKQMVQERGETGKKEYQTMDDMLRNILSRNAEGAVAEQQTREAIKLLQSNQSPGPFDEKMMDVLKIAQRCYQLQRSQSPELEAEIRKIPKYEQILERVALYLEPKGVLILNPAQERTFQGFKNLGAYGKVGMYQKA